MVLLPFCHPIEALKRRCHVPELHIKALAPLFLRPACFTYHHPLPPILDSNFLKLGSSKARRGGRGEEEGKGRRMELVRVRAYVRVCVCVSLGWGTASSFSFCLSPSFFPPQLLNR